MNTTKNATMLRAYACLSQGLGRKLYQSRWGLYDNGAELGQIEVKVKVNKKGEVRVLAPRFIPKVVPNV